VPARAGYQGLGGFDGLLAPDGLLYVRIEILHAERDAREAQAGERVDVGRGGHARIDFDGALGVGQKLKWRWKLRTSRSSSSGFR
jgi:hypothetical protein